MYLPPPGKIAIIGAGPIGLEAALYARYLGYAVDLFERGRVAENVRRCGAEKMTTPLVQCVSPLGLAALAAQDESFRPPQADELLTYREWVDRYLAPLAHSDLVVDGLHEQTTVIRIERLAVPSVSTEEAAENDLPPPSFRLCVRSTLGEESHVDANVVIDASGAGEGSTFSQFGSPCVQSSNTTDRPPASPVISEPNCYILGSKAAGSNCTVAQGLGQIREVFTLIVDRQGLNLYASMQFGQ